MIYNRNEKFIRILNRTLETSLLIYFDTKIIYIRSNGEEIFFNENCISNFRQKKKTEISVNSRTLNRNLFARFIQRRGEKLVISSSQDNTSRDFLGNEVDPLILN